MGKIKTHKATSKRFSLSKNGKVKLNHQFRRHKLGKKTTSVREHFVFVATWPTPLSALPFASLSPTRKPYAGSKQIF